MNSLKYSFIVPVYNRPQEVENLLASIASLDFDREFEVVIIEDGSSLTCEDVCLRFRESVTINYFFKPNSGPGDSRNYGMSRASGNYFIILDSDCLLPVGYLKAVDSNLCKHYVDCFGGPDAAHDRFSNVQKGINYSMTAFLTTGGIRGGSEQLGKFQPRSFNMGLSLKAFKASGGFSEIHPGEDPDLSIRLWELGFETALFNNAFVYHERRISWVPFYKQVMKFGKVRVILNKWYPHTRKFSYWLPSLFVIAALLGIGSFLLGYPLIVFALLFYLLIVFVDGSVKNGFLVGFYSVVATVIQFTGYGMGFLHSYLKIQVFSTNERTAFPELFFDKK